MPQLLRRDAQLGKVAGRTAPVTISTETPVDRVDFLEVLDHRPGAVDLSRAPLPLLVSHNAQMLPIGVIDGLAVADRRLRGVARFGTSELAEQVLADVREGILRSVSIGYERLGEPERIGDRTFRFKFKPYEVSAVAVPADHNAGFFRSHSIMQTTSPLRGRDLVRAALAAAPLDDRVAFRDWITQETAGGNPAEFLLDLGGEAGAYQAWRVATLRALARSAPGEGAALSRALADPAISVEQFRATLLDNITSRTAPPTRTGQLEEDVMQNTISTPYNTGARVQEYSGQLTAFRGKDAERRAYGVGQWFRSILGDPQAARWVSENGLTRTMTGGIFTAGGFAVPDAIANEILANVEMFGLFRQFSRVWPMNTVSLGVPRMTSGVAVGVVGETDATTTSDLTGDQVLLNAKEFAGGTRLSKSLIEDSPIALADYLVSEFGRALAEKEDRCGFLGDGTSTYGGMHGVVAKLNDAAYSGSRVQAGSGHDTAAEIDVADLTALMAALPEYARANAAWYCSASFRDAILTRIAAGAGGNSVETLQQGAGAKFLGYAVRTSPVLASNTGGTYNGSSMILFGDLARTAAFGDRRGMDVVIDQSRFVEYRQVYVQVTERFDIVNHGIPKSTSTVGPMVGLHGRT
jgi:HK97 family phage major capsid protein